MNKSGLFFLGTAAAALGATSYQLVEHGIPVKREYDVEVPEELSGLRLLLLSDLHCNPLICRNDRVIKRLKKEAPDVILFAGDMISRCDERESGRVLAFFQRLAQIAPVVYGMGNHEEALRTYHPEAFAFYRKQVERLSILFPDNEVISLVLQGKNVDFAGFTLKQADYCKRKRRHMPKEAAGELAIPHPERTVLLAHFPDYFPEYASLAPLVVSGHIHGGIIRLPFVGGCISPQLYFPPYTRGCYTEKDSTMVVSAGIGSHTLPARLFNRVEYCIINTKTRKSP